MNGLCCHLVRAMTIIVITGTKMKSSSAVATWPTIWMPRTLIQVMTAISATETS